MRVFLCADQVPMRAQAERHAKDLESQPNVFKFFIFLLLINVSIADEAGRVVR